jgi:hypothetical protein
VNPLFILSILLAASGVFNMLQWSWSSEAAAEHRSEISKIEADKSSDHALFVTEAHNRVASLTKANKEIQDGILSMQTQLQELTDELAASERERIIAQRVRDDLKRQFPAAIDRATAGALRAYAQRSEGDIEFAEDGLERARRDTEKYGREAVSAATASGAFRATLQTRRKLLEARANQITTLTAPAKTDKPTK